MKRNVYDFLIDRIDLKGLPVLILMGDMDRTACQSLNAWLDNVTLEGHRDIGVDLSRVRRVDRAGLAVLLKVMERMRGMRRHVSVVAASAPVRDLLERLGLEFVLLDAESELLIAG